MPPRVSLGLSIVLWLTVIGLAAALSLKYDRQWDWTAGNRNTLTDASRELLRTLPEPIRATAYVFPDAEAQRRIRARFAPYQREKQDFALTFVDPASDPQAVRERGIDSSGQVVLHYQGREESLQLLSEPEISAALQRLGQTERARVVFVAGHGERDPDHQDQAGFSSLASVLQSKGLVLERQTLATRALPPDTRLLVLAAPQQALLPGELERVQAYLANGGSLLWLRDPQLPALPPLAEAVGARWLEGTLIYQDYELLGTGHPALALVAEYPDHAVTRRLDSVTAFALAGAVRPSATGHDWQAAPLLRSVQRAWLETGALEGNLIYDEGKDTLGPLTLGLALQRDEQRVALIADSDFASNAYLGQLGNRAFAVALFQWLLARDAQIHIDLPPAPDRQLQLTPLAVRGLGLGFVVLLPLLLALTGLWRWRQRSRQR